jgi:hypothetical protein
MYVLFGLFEQNKRRSVSRCVARGFEYSHDGIASSGQTFTKNIPDKRRDASASVVLAGTARGHMDLSGVTSFENCMNARRASDRVTQAEIAALFDYDERTVRRWETDGCSGAPSHAILLYLMAKGAVPMSRFLAAKAVCLT